MIDAPGPWGTGPFVLTEGYSRIDERTPQVVLEPNPTHWNPERIPAARIVYDNAIGKEEALASVAAGDGRVDVVMDLSPADARGFSGGGHADVQVKAAKTVLVGVFNETPDDSPWRDVAVRRALNRAVDRAAIVAALDGHAGLLPALIQPGRYGADPSLQPYDHDPEAAKAVAERLGGRSLVVLSSPDWAPVAEALVGQLGGAGITVEVVYGKEEPARWDLRLTWHFDWSPQFPVGVVHREFFGANGGLRAGPEDPAFDALYAKLLGTPHQPAQEEVVREVERYVFEQAKALFLVSPHTLFAVSRRIEFVAYDTCMSELAETRIR